MAYAGQDFTPVGIGSIQFLSFDYSLLLQPDETILSASWAAELSAGEDPSPQNIISGATQVISNGTGVAQLIDLTNTTNVENANIYLLTSSAITSLGQTLLVWAHLPAVTPS